MLCEKVLLDVQVLNIYRPNSGIFSSIDKFRKFPNKFSSLSVNESVLFQQKLLHSGIPFQYIKGQECLKGCITSGAHTRVCDSKVINIIGHHFMVVGYPKSPYSIWIPLSSSQYVSFFGSLLAIDLLHRFMKEW